MSIPLIDIRDVKKIDWTERPNLASELVRAVNATMKADNARRPFPAAIEAYRGEKSAQKHLRNLKRTQNLDSFLGIIKAAGFAIGEARLSHLESGRMQADYWHEPLSNDPNIDRRRRAAFSVGTEIIDHLVETAVELNIPTVYAIPHPVDSGMNSAVLRVCGFVPVSVQSDGIEPDLWQRTLQVA